MFTSTLTTPIPRPDTPRLFFIFTITSILHLHISLLQSSFFHSHPLPAQLLTTLFFLHFHSNFNSPPPNFFFASTLTPTPSLDRSPTPKKLFLFAILIITSILHFFILHPITSILHFCSLTPPPPPLLTEISMLSSHLLGHNVSYT